MKLSFFYVLLNLMLGSLSYAQDKVYIESIEGSSVSLNTSEGPKAAEEGGDLKATDHLKTGNESSVRILYPDGSQLILSHNSELEIDALSEGAHSSHLIEGTVQAIIDKARPKSGGHKFYIRTSVAVMGVRGTNFFVEQVAQEGKAQLHTMEGQVDMAPNLAALKAGKSVPVHQGETIVARRDGLEKKSSFDKKKYLSALQKNHPLIEKLRNRAVKKDSTVPHVAQKNHPDHEKAKTRKSK